MRGIGRIRNLAWRAIAANRRSGVVRAVHQAAAFVAGAWAHNTMNPESNGEGDLLRALAPAKFRTAFDVGANRGDWSLDALRCWPECALHSFEVAPETFRMLTKALEGASGRERAALNPMGLGEAAQSLKMYYFPDHPDQTCDLPRHQSYRTVEFDARIEKGDAYCDARGIERVDFLKIDVEGAEYRVMKGFERRLRAGDVHCIQFEYGAFSTQTRFLLADYYAMLGANYWVGKIFPGYVEFADYSWTMENFQFCNYCCVSRKREDLRRLVAG